MEKLKDYKEIFSEGMVIKNYKELCAMLDWKPSSGNKKIAQMKEFDRFCVIEKKGHSIIIKEVRDKPLPPQEIDYARNTKFADSVKYLLIAFAKNTESGYAIVKNRDMYTSLGFGNKMLHNDSKKNFAQKRNIAEKMDVDIKNYIEFVDYVNQSARGAVNVAISSLQRDRIIRNHKYTFMMCIGDLNVHEFRLANQEEHNAISDAEYEAYTEMGYKTLRQALFSDKEGFNDLVRGKLTERIDANYNYHYSVHYFDFNNSIIEDAFERQQVADKILDVSNTFSIEQEKTFIRRHTKALEGYEEAIEFQSDLDMIFESFEDDREKFGELSNGKVSTMMRKANRIVARSSDMFVVDMNKINLKYFPFKEADMFEEPYSEFWKGLK